MSEYIIEWFDIGGQLANLLNGNMPLVLWPKKIREERLREKIVRCRDCVDFDHWEYADGTTRNVCARFEFVDVTPDGFCAWSERRKP